jgi:hypothetical protein
VDQWKWYEIAEHISSIEGRTISTSRCQQIAERALEKLYLALLEDPDIKDYWHGVMYSERPRDKKGRFIR